MRRPAEPCVPETLEPEWPVPPGVRAFVTTRALGDVKDPVVRARLYALLPSVPVWLKQVHGTVVVDAADVVPGAQPDADASSTSAREVVCTVMAADCMPVLIAAQDGSVVGAAHAGWRGLRAGVIERAIDSMPVPAASLQAWLGPAIGPQAYEVGVEVREAFIANDPAAASAFTPTRPGHWLLDLYAVARQRLEAKGVGAVFGGTHCTHSEPGRFFSFRRDKATQRMAACIWRV